MTLTAPLAFILSLFGSAILSRPKLPELEPDKLKALSADFERLRAHRHGLLEQNTRLLACRDAARADRDQSDAQLRTLRAAHDALLRMFVEEQRTRLQLERDLIEAQARLESYRSNDHRSQAPRHLPLPIAPLTEGPRPVQAPQALSSEQAQRLGAQALTQIQMLREPPLMPVISDSLQVAMRQMDAFICNCAPGRHEAMFGTIDIEGDDTV
jgi:hypothetical protein